jgi:hypothetical protein
VSAEQARKREVIHAEQAAVRLAGFLERELERLPPEHPTARSYRESLRRLRRRTRLRRLLR